MKNGRPKKPEIDLATLASSYLAPLRERKALIITIVFFSFSIAFSLSMFASHEYVSRATVTVEEPKYNIQSKKEESMVAKQAADEYVLAQVEKLKSRTFADKVLKVLPEQAVNDLSAHSDLVSQIITGVVQSLRAWSGEELFQQIKYLLRKKTDPQSTSTEREQLLRNLMEKVSVSSKSKVGVVQITAKSVNKECAVILATKFMEVWFAENLEENRKDVRAAKDFTEGLKSKARQEFLDAEAKLIAYKQKYDIPGDPRVILDGVTQTELDSLRSGMEMAKEHFQVMDRISVETGVKEASVMNNIRMIDAASLPVSPLENVRNRIRMIGLFGGLLVGVGLVLLHELIAGPIRNEMDILKTVQTPIIGSLPKDMYPAPRR